MERRLALMTPTPGTAAECLICQKPGARNGKSPNKYCDRTRPGASRRQEGIEAGHIAHGGKRQRGGQSPAAWPLPVSMPEHWKLLSMQGIFDCRCTRLAPCRTLPSANKYSHVSVPLAQMLQARQDLQYCPEVTSVGETNVATMAPKTVSPLKLGNCYGWNSTAPHQVMLRPTRSRVCTQGEICA